MQEDHLVAAFVAHDHEQRALVGIYAVLEHHADAVVYLLLYHLNGCNTRAEMFNFVVIVAEKSICNYRKTCIFASLILRAIINIFK